DQPPGAVKCQDCGQPLNTAAPGAPPSPLTVEPAPPLAEPPPSADDGLMPCPHCGERILSNSTFCRFCREHVEGESRPWERPGRRVRRDVDPHRGNLILVLGILGLVIPLIGLGLGITAWVMGRRDLARMDRRELDPDGRGLTQA